jgi:histidinol-phosphate aminotransferase
LTFVQRGNAQERRPVPATPLRLDLLVNPYGASLRVQEAIASVDELHLPRPEQQAQLRRCLAERHGLPEGWIVLGNGIDDLVLATLKLPGRPVVLFPPTDESICRLAAWLGVETAGAERSDRYMVELGPNADELPRGSIAYVQSPNDPTGTILTAQEAVRLARRCRLLIVDERHAPYSPRTLVPYVREFENVVVLRTFETWAGLAGLPIAYAIAPAALAAAIGERRFRQEVAGAAVIAAQATMQDLPWVEATVERVREEKARLFRTLRKLNMVQPFPSWANFLLARVERGEADHFAAELFRRAIRVHRPSHPALANCFRISATTAEATAALKAAFIEAAREL